MNHFLKFLRDESGPNNFRIVAMAIFAGVVNGLLVSVIVTAAEKSASGGSDLQYLAFFMLCFGAFLFSRHFVLVQTNRLTEEIVTKIRLKIIDKIRRSDLLLFERVGKVRIASALSHDTMTLSECASMLASALSSAIMLIVAVAYIAFLSRTAFILTMLSIGAGVVYYQMSRKSIDMDLRASTQKEHEFLSLLGHLLDGFKEVKMHEERNEDLYENHICTTAYCGQQLKTRAGEGFAKISVFSQAFFYALIGVILFILPTLQKDDTGVVVQIASVILFIIGPLTDLVGSAPSLMRANVAVANIQELEDALNANSVFEPGVKDLSVLSHVPEMEEIACDEVTFRYNDLNGESFSIGPISLRIPAKEILFIVGGNGSGKSTFIKVLAGLYPPASGRLTMNGHAISPTNLIQYRSLFSTVFTDFHLFDRPYGLAGEAESHLDDLLRTFKIWDKTSLRHGIFSSTDLSTGQKKRLALAISLLERRPVMLFDEIAADQDPEFRKYLYEVILKELQKQNKTLIVITHDDSYFHLADRVLKMEYGQIVSEQMRGA